MRESTQRNTAPQEEAPAEKPGLTELLQTLTGNNTIASTFRRMELAEHIIAAVKSETPLLTPIIDDAFKHLLPTDALHRMPDALYEHHCRELIARTIDGKDVRPGTTAELLATLSTQDVPTLRRG